MKKLLALALAIVMLFTLCACGANTAAKPAQDGTAASDSGSASTGDTISLSFSSHDSSTSAHGLFFEDWANRVNEASGGKVDVTVYHAAALTAPADGINALNSGVCDILWTCLGFFPGQFPVTEAATMPFNGLVNASQGANVLYDAWDSIPEVKAEWEAQGLKPLIFLTAPASYILSTCKFEQPSDFQGKTLRCMAGIPTNMIDKLGATAVVTPSGEIFTSMQKDIIQGTVFDMAGAKGFKLFEVTDYVMELPLYSQVLVILMTQAKWDSLPEDVQKAIESCSGLDTALEYAGRLETDSDEYLAQFAEAGKMVKNTDEQVAAFETLGSELAESYIADSTVDGYGDIVDQFNALIEKYAQ